MTTNTVILKAIFSGPGCFPALDVRLIRGFSYKETARRIKAGDWCFMIESGREDPAIDNLLEELVRPPQAYVDFSDLGVLAFKMEAYGMGFDFEFDYDSSPSGGETMSRIRDLHTRETLWRRDRSKSEVPVFAEELP